MRLRNRPTDQQVKDETTARIEAAGYPDHEQRNVLMSGDIEAIELMRTTIEAIRAKGSALRAAPGGTPGNFRDPENWT